MLTYTRCHICLVETENSIICERCTAIGELKRAENAEFDEVFAEEETDGF